ncbi:MAG: hypothetical protein JXA09_14680 [Anaerolineae bacterium]|nr:hypothetical protein [Anaerolineae bacterium]
MAPRGKRVSASEVGQYAYCARAWWLGTVEGITPVDPYLLTQGARQHERHGWRVALARVVRRLALGLLAAAALGLLGWGIHALSER